MDEITVINISGARTRFMAGRRVLFALGTDLWRQERLIAFSNLMFRNRERITGEEWHSQI
ncbi:MAG: hypothetical protein ACT4OS_06455 [Acidimicrobiales bacterium]